jgi:hypothetical protein
MREFTDPVYGITGNYEGIREQAEQEKHNVYRVDPKSGDIKVVVDDFVEPYPRLPAKRSAKRSRRKASRTKSTKTRVLAGSSVRVA